MNGKKYADGGNFQIGLHIKYVSDKLKSYANAHFAQYGMTSSQAMYIAYIGFSGGSIPQKDLERHFNVSHPTVTGVIARLEKKGFVKVRADETDRRNNIVELTEKALSAGRDFDRSRSELEKQLISGLSDEEISELLRLLGVLEKNLGLDTINGGD